MTWPGRRRRYLAALVLAWVVLPVAAACTPPYLPDPLTPLSSGSVPPPPTPSGTVTIGVDAGIRGFNPYVQAQYSPAGAAISSLVLPGVFAPGAASPSDQPTALVESAEVTATSPFTVTYQLNRNASWSDGTPIAAEDFTYLWQQMVSTPGVVDPGGYQLIQSITSANAGKTVEVVFAARYAQWRSLFSPLLPARVLKDDPGGFAGALGGSIPVAGSAYRMDAYDPVIGQVTLLRNDKYWGSDTAVNTAVFREGAGADLLAGLQRGDLQAVYLQPDATTAAGLSGATDLRLHTAPLPASTGFSFNLGTGHPTAAQAVRTAVAYAVQGAALRDVLTGGNPAAALAVTSQLVLPAESGAPAAVPDGYTTDPAGVGTALTAAGFSRDGLYYRRDGRVLSVVLGYPATDTRLAAVARLVQRQLGSAGIQTNLVQLSPADVQLDLTAASQPDLVLRTVTRSSSDLAGAVVATGCVEQLQAAAAQPPASTSAGSPATRTGSTAGTTVSSSSSTPATAVPSPGLPNGCDPQVLDTTRKLLTGVDVLPTIDEQLWTGMTALPVAEPVVTLAMGPSLASATVSDDPARSLWSGLLHNLRSWPAA